MTDYPHINLVGAEIEGRWEDMPPVGELHYDGSVKFEMEVEEPVGPPPPPDAPPEFDRETETRLRQTTGQGTLGETINPEGPLIGEAVSDPLDPKSVLRWLGHNYPDETNRTCGLHVHVSMRPKHYQWLMDEAFHEYSMDRLQTFGQEHDVPEQYHRRVNGRNDTCRDRWDTDQQVQRECRPGHCQCNERYRIWNFHAHRAHGTLECRVFPAYENLTLARESVLLVCDTVCSFIEQYDAGPVFFDAQPSPMTTEKIKL